MKFLYINRSRFVFRPEQTTTISSLSFDGICNNEDGAESSSVESISVSGPSLLPVSDSSVGTETRFCRQVFLGGDFWGVLANRSSSLSSLIISTRVLDFVKGILLKKVLSSELLKVSKSQKDFFLTLHCPKNERNITQNSAQWGKARAEFCLIFCSFFGQWNFKKKCFWDLLTFRR